MAEYTSHEDQDSDMEYELDLNSYADFDYDAFVKKFCDVSIKPRDTKREAHSHNTNHRTLPALSKILAAPKQQHAQQTESTPCPPLPDEVLGTIFSYLPQATLRACASLVCRDWARVCQFMVRRVGVWKTMSEDSHQQLLNQMPKINTLVCWILQDPELQPDYWTSIDPISALKMWNKFVRAVTKPLQSRGLKKGTDCLLDNIKEIVIHGDYISYKRVIAPLLPHLQYLRILRLDFQRDNASMDLFPILDHCLNLKELTVKGAINRFLLIRADGEDQELESADVPEPPPKEELESYIHENQPTPIYPQRHGILCIVFHEVVISQRTLERIIVTCPLLRTLKATEMKKYRPVPSQPGMLQPVHLDRGRIARLVRGYCPHMEWLALMQSLEPEQVWSTTVRPIRQGYDSRPPPPVLYEWFAAKETRYLSASMDALSFNILGYYKRAQDILNNLTILEIPDALAPQHQESELLSELLSTTPHLEHFQASRARFHVPSYNYRKCGKLQSLDLGLHGPAPDISGLFRKRLYCPVLRYICLRCESVHVGQLVNYPSHNKDPTVAAPPKRFPDRLKELCALRNLETVKIYTDIIPGIVTGSDFEYLRLPLDRQRGLPYLASMVFVYRASPMKNGYRDVLKALEEFRPGVEFRFIEQCTTDGAL